MIQVVKLKDYERYAGRRTRYSDRQPCKASLALIGLVGYVGADVDRRSAYGPRPVARSVTTGETISVYVSRTLTLESASGRTEVELPSSFRDYHFLYDVKVPSGQVQHRRCCGPAVRLTKVSARLYTAHASEYRKSPESSDRA